MPRSNSITLSGTVQHVFAHRFTLEADGNVCLADLTPKGLAAFPLATGLAVSLEGEVRPSEIKVTRITAAGREPVCIEHKKPHHKPGHKHIEALAYPDLVLAAVRAAGWSTSGAMQRRPKHYEVLAHRDGGQATELHVDFAGAIHKQKLADPAKWAVEA